MRPALRWLLLVTLGLSALALWWPSSGPPPLVGAVQRLADRQLAPAASRRAVDAASFPQPLPHATPALHVEPARRDIFASASPAAGSKSTSSDPRGSLAAGARPPAPLPPMPPPTAAPPAVLAAAAAPAANVALRVRYLGTMVTPMGERLVLLSRGDVAFVARAGLKLHDGFAIESVGSAAVRIVHESSGRVVDIAVPVTLGASTAR